MVHRVQVEWSGFPGAPGLSTFYVTDGPTGVGPISSFFTAIRNYLPVDVHINVPASGDVLDPITGLITGVWAGGTPTPTVGNDAAGYNAAGGAMIKWSTAGIVRGHRVRGRTFIVPLGGDLYQTDGTLDNGVAAGLVLDATNLVTALSTNLFVWSRPRKATPQWTDVRGRVHAAKLASAGEVFPIVGAVVPDKSVVLRSRRD